MQSVPKQLRFPLAGIAADIDYRSATFPADEGTYATPMAVNVIGDCAFAQRKRGGSRPALVAVSGVASSDSGRWLWPNGEPVAWPDGNGISFATLGATVLLPDGSHILQPHETFTLYRDRLVRSDGSVWMASRTGARDDFDFGGDADDPSRAVAGNVAFAGREGEPITALAAVRDDFLYIATKRSLWLVRGEPTSQMANVSEFTGIVSPHAWCWDSRRFYFLGPNGLYAHSPDEPLACLSTRLPDDLSGIEAATLLYDAEYEGIHILLGDGTAWFYDIAAKAFWLCAYNAAIAPVSGGYALLSGSGGVAPRVVFLCADGAWRRWDASADSDAGLYSIVSSVAIGPFRCGQRDDRDGMLDALTATLALGSADVTLFCHFADSAEAAVARAKASEVDAEFTVKAGWNRNLRPRRRGAWCVLVLASTGRWAYEGILATTKPLGRLR